MKVGILGCSGLVGQKYVSLLKKHPFFEVCFLAASKKHVGQMSNGIAISALDEAFSSECELFFSALPSSVGSSVEQRLVQEGKWVVSSSSAFRGHENVPCIIPEINAHHLDRIHLQRKAYGTTTGGLVTKPNCTLQSFLLPLFPLHRVAGLTSVTTSNLQALSGAGKKWRKAHIDTIDPFIPLEEEKTESEPALILDDTSIHFSSHCVRVPILHGHMSLVNATFAKPLQREEIRLLWNEFTGLSLPSSPLHPVLYTEDQHGPQHAKDLENGSGMAVTVGRLRPCGIHGIKFISLSHNLIRGAAGGGVLIGELIAQKEYGYVREKSALCAAS